MGSWVEELPSGKWQARYTLPDGRKRSAGAFVHKARAQKEAAIAEGEAASLGWRDPRAAQKTWGEWRETWWATRGVAPGTLARDLSPLNKHLRPQWDAVPLVDITRHSVKSWAASLARQGLAPSSVQRHLHVFSASLTAAVDAEVLVTNPAYRLKLPGGQTDVHRYLTRDEAGALMAEFADPAFVALLLGTGLRWGEAAGLQWKRIDLERGKIRVAEVWDDKTSSLKAYPKGRKIRDVPLPDWVAEQLPSGSGLVFGEMIYTNWRKRQWLPALERTVLGHVRPHDCRHTYASWLIQDGVSLAEVGRLLGHVSPTTTQRYAHLADAPREHILRAISDPRRPA